MAKKKGTLAIEELPVEKTPVHFWTNGGDEVLILRFVSKDGTAYGGFQHPLEVGQAVTAPDWHDRPECGGGIHGWPWGIGLGDGKESEWDALWQVYGVATADIVLIENSSKVKFRTGVLRHFGDWHSAFLAILDGQKAWVEHHADSASSATGYRSASSATGDSSASSATGDSSASSATGYRSASSATGYRSASSATGDSSASSATGDSSASSATGYRSASSATGDSSASSATGDSSAAAATGLKGRAQCGPWGCLALSWWNEAEGRAEMRCREVGIGDGSDGKLKALVWYRLDNKGEFMEASE